MLGRCDPRGERGTIEDGTYVLESATYYGVCPPANEIAITVTGGDAGPAPLTLTESCPAVTSFSRSYDVTPGRIAFTFPSLADSTEVDTYARQ